MEMQRTPKEHLSSFLKYSATSGVIATAIVGILTYFDPGLQEIAQHITTLTMIAVNGLLVIWFKLVWKP